MNTPTPDSTETQEQGSYLSPNSTLIHTLSAGLLRDTGASQHELALGAEAAFHGVLPTGAHVAITVLRAATFTVAVHQGGWTGHGTKIRCPPVNTDPIGAAEVGVRGNHLAHLLSVATVLLADGIERGRIEDLVALSKLCRKEELAAGAGRDRTLLLGNGLTCLPWLLHCPFLDKPWQVRGHCPVLQHEVIGPILITSATQTIRLGSKGLGAELQLELIVLWSEREDVAKIIESDFMHDGTIDTGFYVPTRIWDRHQFSIHCHLHVAVELNGQDTMLHFNGFHAGRACPRAAGTITKNHLQILLLVLK